MRVESVASFSATCTQNSSQIKYIFTMYKREDGLCTISAVAEHILRAPSELSSRLLPNQNNPLSVFHDVCLCNNRQQFLLLQPNRFEVVAAQFNAIYHNTISIGNIGNRLFVEV